MLVEVRCEESNFERIFVTRMNNLFIKSSKLNLVKALLRTKEFCGDVILLVCFHWNGLGEKQLVDFG